MADRNDRPDAQDVRAYFERAAEQFDRLYVDEQQGAVMRWLNRRFRSDLARRYAIAMAHVQSSGAKSVLDVGCGSGRYLAGLARLGVERIVGTDQSGAMLTLAREALSVSQAQNVELIQADFVRWEPAEQFDVIIAMGFFDYQQDPLVVLSKMRRLAQHSVVASFPSRHWLRTPIRRVRYYFKRCPVHFYRRGDVERLCRGAGFARCEIAPIPFGGVDYVTTFWT